jgi:hypothetical protein
LSVGINGKMLTTSTLPVASFYEVWHWTASAVLVHLWGPGLISPYSDSLRAAGSRDRIPADPSGREVYK